jgi:hypothetical protein
MKHANTDQMANYNAIAKPSHIRPISSYRLAERLREHGIYSGQARSTALFQLATDLPAAVLARMLGIHITVAVAWQRASAGDWAAYAARTAGGRAAPTTAIPRA